MSRGKEILGRLLGPRLDPDELHPLDTDLADLALPVVELLRRYFRAEVHGMHRMPDGPALVVGNHNAGITFLDPFFMGLAWYRRDRGREPMSYLAHDAMVTMPGMGNFLLSIGAIRASHDNADTAFAAGRKVVVFPGGNYEAFRTYRERHRVDFGGKTGFVRLALRSRVPIVPVLHLGGHETFVVLRRGERIARAIGARKWLRSESWPIFLGLPWGVGVGPIFHLPLPAKILVEVGEPMPVEEYAPEVVEDPSRIDDRPTLKAASLRVQQRLQEMMHAQARHRRWPVLG